VVICWTIKLSYFIATIGHMVSDEEMEAIIIGQEDLPTRLKWKWKFISPLHIVRYLQIPFGVDVPVKVVWD
jgi:hypothetical protein